MTYPVQKTDEQWRQELSREEYAVLRQAGTERPFTGEYNDTTTEGVYSCRACGHELFRSDTKFDSHCGWPSFYAPERGGQRRADRGPQPRACGASRSAAAAAARTSATCSTTPRRRRRATATA